MAIKAVSGDATLGLTSDVATSVAIFEPFTAFTAQGWFYTGTTGSSRPIFTIGEAQTRLGAGSYVEISVSASDLLTLKVWDGSTLHTHTGATLTADTWYAWAYVKGEATDKHSVYVSGDVASPEFTTASIAQTIVDNVASIGGIFLSAPATTRVCNFKLWNAVKTVTLLNANRITWIPSPASITSLRHTAPLRFPLDTYNYHPSFGGTAFDSPTYSNGYRAHLVNIASTDLEYAVDPSVLKIVPCMTQVSTPQPFDLVSDTTDPLFSTDPTVIINRQFQMSQDSAIGWPIGAVINAVDVWFTTQRVEAGGLTASELFFAIVGANDGEPADVNDPPDVESASIGISAAYVHRGTNSNNPIGVSSERDPIAVEDWDTLDPAVALARVFAYWWGYQIQWSGVLPLQLSYPDTYNTSEVYLRITYSLPSDWTFTGTEGEGEEDEPTTSIWRLDDGGGGTGDGTDGGGDDSGDSPDGAADDNGETFFASLITRPFTPTNIMNRMNVSSGFLAVKGAVGVNVNVSLIENLKTIRDTTTVDLAPVGLEGADLLRRLDELSVRNMTLVQVKFSDSDEPGGRWNLQRFEMRATVDEKGS